MPRLQTTPVSLETEQAGEVVARAARIATPRAGPQNRERRAPREGLGPDPADQRWPGTVRRMRAANDTEQSRRRARLRWSQILFASRLLRGVVRASKPRHKNCCQTRRRSRTATAVKSTIRVHESQVSRRWTNPGSPATRRAASLASSRLTLRRKARQAPQYTDCCCSKSFRISAAT